MNSPLVLAAGVILLFIGIIVRDIRVIGPIIGLSGVGLIAVGFIMSWINAVKYNESHPEERANAHPSAELFRASEKAIDKEAAKVYTKALRDGKDEFEARQAKREYASSQKEELRDRYRD